MLISFIVLCLMMAKNNVDYTKYVYCFYILIACISVLLFMAYNCHDDIKKKTSLVPHVVHVLPFKCQLPEYLVACSIILIIYSFHTICLQLCICLIFIKENLSVYAWYFFSSIRISYHWRHKFSSQIQYFLLIYVWIYWLIRYFV